MTDVDIMLRFMLQLLVVLGSCKVVGWIGQRFLGQTQVVMEMVTGVMLGPSLLGKFFPTVQAYIFPSGIVGHVGDAPLKHPSMSILYVVAQIGLVLYMFLVGMEFDLSLLSKRVQGALGVSFLGILLPFGFGALVAVWVHGRPDVPLFAPSVTVIQAALYVGAAMCITAFPMLARILFENGISQTHMGTLALAAGASNDACAWALLAVVVSVNKGDLSYGLLAIVGGAAFAVFILTVGKKLFEPLKASAESPGGLTQAAFLTTMFILFGAAYITDAIHLYAVFGAFLTGAAMPKGAFAAAMRSRIEAIVVGCFLPFFFVYSGLNTNLGSLNSPMLWLVCGLMCLAAIAGKFGGCAIAARISGEDWKSSNAIGFLMNSRGLMELIILNIGKEKGLITTELYTMLVVMAIITTLMASPAFKWVMKGRISTLSGSVNPAFGE